MSFLKHKEIFPTGRVVTEGADITAGAEKLFSTLQDTRHNIKLIEASKVQFVVIVYCLLFVVVEEKF